MNTAKPSQPIDSVGIFDPSENQQKIVTVTPEAIAHFQRHLKQRGHGSGIRVSTRTSGCSGYAYQLDYVDEPIAGDIECDVNGKLLVFVDPKSLPIIKGTEIDLVTQGINKAIDFNNPNATASCGCGESFSIAVDDDS